MYYCSEVIYIVMIPNILIYSNENKGSSLSLPAHGRAGARATPFLVALFAKQKTKFGGGGKARAGKNSFPQPPSFCPPERKLSKVSVWIFAEKSSDFVQDRQHIQNISDNYRRYFVCAAGLGFEPR